MSTFKRTFMIAYLVCSLAVLVLFALALLLPGGADMMAFLHSCVPLAILLILVLLVMIVGLVAYTGAALLMSITRATARLRATESGEISIEKSALVSTASRALEQVSDMTLQGLTVDVLQRGDTAIIDARVVATPLGTDSLMTLAGRIQATTKRALEAFTEHEVRYVAVNFVEPRRRGEQMSAGPDPDTYESPFEGARERAEQDRQSEEERRRAEARERKAAAAEQVAAARVVPAEDEPAGGPVDGAFDEGAGMTDDAGRDPWSPAVEAPAKKPSLWERAKAKASGLRSRLNAEDVVETRAEVISEEYPAASADAAQVSARGQVDGDASQVGTGRAASDDMWPDADVDAPSAESGAAFAYEPGDAAADEGRASVQTEGDGAPAAAGDADAPVRGADESSTSEGLGTRRRGAL